MKWPALVLAASLAFLNNGLLAQPSSEARQLAQEVIDLQSNDILMQGMRQMIANITQQLRQHFPEPKLNKKQQEILQRHMAELTDEMLGPAYLGKIKSAAVDIFVATYTPDELRGIRDFYRSPAGRAFVEKTPQVMLRMSPIAMDAMTPMLERIKERQIQLMQEMRAAE